MTKNIFATSTIQKMLRSSILKNNIIKILIVFSILIPTGTIFVLNIGGNINDTLFSNSYLIIWTFFLSSSVIAAYGVFVVFVKSKTNNVDLYLYITSTRKATLVNIKIRTIILIIFTVNLVSLISASTTIFILGAELVQLGIFIGSIFAMNLSFILLVYFLAIIGLYLNPFAAAIVIGLTVASISALPLGSRLIKNNVNNFTYNQRLNNVNYLDVLEFDENDELIESNYGLISNVNNELNEISTKNQLSVTNKIGHYNFLDTAAMPSISIMSFFSKYNDYESVISSAFGVKEVVVSMTPTEKIENKIIAMPVGGYNPFDKTPQELGEEIVKELRFLNTENNLTGVDYSALHSKLQNNINWSGVLSESDKDLIATLTGIDNNASPFYWIINESNILTPKIANVPKLIEEAVGQEARDLIAFLWRDEIVFDNIFNLGNIKSIEEINNIYPSLRTYDEFGEVHEQDMYFFKNNLTRVLYDETNSNIVDFQVLDNTGVYKSTTESLSTIIGENITDKNGWDNYLDKYNTINNMEDLYSKISSNIGPSAYQMKFRDNKINIYVIDGLFDEEFENINKLQWTWVGVYPILLILLSWIAKRKVSKKDVI